MKVSTAMLSLALLFVLACSSSEPIVPSKPLEISSEFAKRTRDFSFDFLKTLHQKEESNKNFFVSPLGLHMALGMLLNGSAMGSEQELLKTLKLEGLSMNDVNDNYLKLVEGLPLVDAKVTNTLANSMWKDVNFSSEKAFQEVLSKYFKAQLYQENFGQKATVEKINKWASDNTNNKIKKVLEEISPDQVMFLINALYFKGDWASQFDPQSTYKSTFMGNSTNSQVDMMTKTDTVGFAELPTYKVAELSYGSGQYSMLILLPNANTSLDAVIKNLNTNSWEETLKNISVRKIEMEIPKIKMEYSVELNDVLKDMGMPTLFTNSADLSKISAPAGKIKVGFVKQDSFVEIDEKGTEAAAVTTIGVELTSIPVYPSFICNRPYLFFIREKNSNTIQFMGKIVNL